MRVFMAERGRELRGKKHKKRHRKPPQTARHFKETERGVRGEVSCWWKGALILSLTSSCGQEEIQTVGSGSTGLPKEGLKQ